ncbi:non-ribosomal peptide synthetase [Sorangium atrum]|uniref:Amino acid adenylation domain-containing protein n=1 Tax=Sorangium atrum TaxID=2995308 RepID=A0ABT5BZU9_9BACT|nr:amino acid adenylation domain-containing protein [Sorangium aterium]MDC0679233.1 amino acid adenylation domain-containing protein [Sorangium aterium]
MRAHATQARLSHAPGELPRELPALDLATDRPRPPAPSRRRASVSRELPPRLALELDRVRRGSGATLFVTLLSAYAALLYRHTVQSEILIGTPWPRRGGRRGWPAAPGPRHPLVLHARIDEELSFRDLLAQIAAQIASAEGRRHVPPDEPLAEPGAADDTSDHPMFQTTFELARPGDVPRRAALKAATAARRSRARPATPVDLSLSVTASERGLAATMTYSTDVFDPGTIERLLDHLGLLLAGVAEDAERPIAEIPLLTPEERRRMTVVWNATRTAYPRDACVHELFEEHVARTPDAIAVIEGGEALTYRELNRRANRLAHRISARRAGPDLRVAVVVERSSSALVALLGVLKAGGAYVPLDPSYPDERLRFMLEDAAVSLVLGQRALVTRLDFRGEVMCLDEDHGAPGDDRNPAIPAAPTDLAYVMFTSGSTGRPKGVAVPHRGVVRLVRDTGYVAFGPSDRVAHASSLSFDASTFEIWGALLNGACLVIVSHETLLSPEAMPALLRREGITVLFLTTALFHHLARVGPDAFQGLSYLVVGGDVLNPTLSREVLLKGPPKHLVNGYGPTENTTFSTAHLVRAVPEGASRVPIGRPISNTRAYVLDRRLQPVPVGVPGELYVAGDGLARGYLNRPDLTAAAFVQNPLPEEPGERLYRTGDQVRYLADGSLDFLGRIDAQVKIRGFRVELGEIEAALCACPSVREAVVVLHEHAPGDMRLVAYVVSDFGPGGPPSRPPCGDRSQGAEAGVDSSGPASCGPASRDLSRSLRRCLQEKLPDYMIPAAFVVVPKLPLAATGKVDRKTLPPPDVGRLHAGEPESSRSPIERQVAEIWASVLHTDRPEVDDDFFELGGDSLLAAQVLLQVRTVFHVDVPARRLFESPTLAGLARAVEEALRWKARGARGSMGAIDLRAEAALAPDIRPCGSLVDTSAPPRHVFLTGATGFLGAFLVRDLLTQTRATVHCLVRAPDAAAGLARLRRSLEAYSLWDPAASARIVAVPGDLKEPLLGLTPACFEALAQRIDAIYHAGAEVNYIKPYASHKAANVLGTQEVLRLACLRRTKPVHHVSTIGITGQIGYFTGARTVRESDDLDRWVDHLHTDMGYSQSKWVAEKLVWLAHGRGVPVTVFRPGFILGHSQTGAANVADFVSRMIKGCVEMGCAPDLPAQSKEFVTVDYVSRAIVHLSCRPGSLGKAFHLVPPSSQRLDLNGFFDLLVSRGYPLVRLPYAQWCEQLLAWIRRSGDSPFLPLLPMLTEKVHGDLTRWELYAQMPAYDCQNTIDGLAGTAIACPPMDARLLDTLLAYYLRSGHLSAPAPAASGVRLAAPRARSPLRWQDVARTRRGAHG